MTKKTLMRILGIDEAGRGPVIGPLVVAGVSIDEKDEPFLKDLGVKDSKLLSPKKRENLEKQIRKIAKNVRVIVIPAKKIDEKMTRMSLNAIEMDAMAEIINTIKSEKTIIDLPSTSSAFAQELKAKTKREIIAEHKADEKYPAVSAASIVAKVRRDSEIKLIEKKHNILFGSGYPADPVTQKYLKKLAESTEKLPDFVRKSWQTTKDFLIEKNQKKLGEF